MKEFVLNNWYYLVMGIIYVLFIVYTFIRNKIEKKKTNTRKLLCSAIDNFIMDAEKMAHYTGKEKKAYVMTRAISIANKAMTENEIDAYVETQVALTKNVNIKK